MRGLAGSAVLLVACNGAGDAAREPPPAGLPWVGEAFDLRIGVAATTCAATGLPWASTFSQAIVVQSGARVTLTLQHAADFEVRDVELDGCVVETGAGAFALRLSGSARAAALQGEATCAVRLSLPAALGRAIDSAEAAAALEGTAVAPLGATEDAWLAAGCPAATGGADDYPAFDLPLCADGGLRGTVSAELAWAGAACHAGEPCTLELAFDGVLAAPHPDEPAGAVRGGVCAAQGIDTR
ncbi:hypothetical protein L6V77_12355 [Myxococcota bacterium]|nr:hypothetical protein [Myxococcota bacterium]